MLLNDLYDYFGTQLEVKKGTGFSRASQRRWIENGYIPYETQKKIEKKTKGKLIAGQPKSLKELKQESDELFRKNPTYVYIHPRYGQCEVVHIYYNEGRIKQIEMITEDSKRVTRYDSMYLFSVPEVKWPRPE